MFHPGQLVEVKEGVSYEVYRDNHYVGGYWLGHRVGKVIGVYEKIGETDWPMPPNFWRVQLFPEDSDPRELKDCDHVVFLHAKQMTAVTGEPQQCEICLKVIPYGYQCGECKASAAFTAALMARQIQTKMAEVQQDNWKYIGFPTIKPQKKSALVELLLASCRWVWRMIKVMLHLEK